MSRQRIVLLGATGSIGDQTLHLINRFSQQDKDHGGFEVVGMTARKNAEKLLERCDQFSCPKFYLSDVVTGDPRQVLDPDELISSDIDHLIVADHGLESFELVVKALTLRKKVSIANKELLIVHGQDILYLAREQNTEVIPLDSEHNALFQCLRGEDPASVKRLVITASGGPFRDQAFSDLQDVTVQQVLNHPNWAMGQKTTVDSATLVNKAFEVIETHHLFGIPYENIEVRLHPESIVHGMVEFHDGNIKMLAYAPDMRYSIGYALFYPERAPEHLVETEKAWNYDSDLHFERIDKGRYPCFDLVLETAREKPQSLSQIVANDEWAVDEFLSGKIAFGDILTCLEEGLS